MKCAILTMCLCCSVAVAAETESFTFPRNTPESQGIASSAILDFVATADRDIAEMHSFMLIRICETPHCLTLRLNFTGDQLLLDSEMNVAFGPTKRPQLRGRLAQ